MNRQFFLGLLLLAMAFVSCAKRNEACMPPPASDKDAEYEQLIDSMTRTICDARYHTFSDTTLKPVLAFYEQCHTPRSLWMQACCHNLLGGLTFERNHISEEAANHYLEALRILDTHFDASQAQVGRLYSKVHFVLSRMAYNFSDKPSALRFAIKGLDYATAIGDTSWVLRSCANLGMMFDRFGRGGDGDSAFLYCEEGLRWSDTIRYRYESAFVYNALANSLRHSHLYDSALFYFNRCERLVDSTHQFYHKNYTEKAFVYYQMHDYATAAADLLEAFKTRDYSLKAQAATGLADCYEKMGDTLSAMPYYAIVKAFRENDILASNHNAATMSLLNAYLKGKNAPKNGKVWLWVALLLSVLVAVLLVRHRRIKRHLQEAHGLVEEQAQQALLMKVQAIYDDKRSNTFGRIREVFDEAFPEAVARLKAAFPDLNDTEVDVCVLSMFPFRVKEIADILNLRENTVSKYRTSIRKKTQADSVEVLWKRFIG